MMFTKNFRKNNSFFSGIFVCFFLSFFSNFSFGQQNNNLTPKLLPFPSPYDDVVEDCIKQAAREDKKMLKNTLLHKTFFENELSKAGLHQVYTYLPLVVQKIQQENKRAFYTAGVWGLPFLIAVKYGLTINDKIDERYCVKKSTAAAIAYLQDISRKAKDEWEVVIAYSNSLSALEAAKIRTNNAEDIWILYEFGHLPNKNCIPYFIAYTHMADFNLFEYPKSTEIETRKKHISVCVKKEIDIRNFTSILDIDENQFKYNNPIFIGDVLIPDFDIQIPTEKYNLFVQKEDSIYLYNDSIQKITDSLEKINSVSNIETNIPKYYTVKNGDMLGRIAQKYGITVEQLKRWNNLSNDIIQPGQRLIVNKDVKSNNTTAVNPTTKKEIYIVKSGDTLGGIARKYNVSVNNLKTWNNLKNDNIGINQKIVILK